MSAPVLSSEYQDWPGLLARIAELIGPELALRLADECGGIDALYIPHKPSAHHLWAASIGIDALAVLSKELGGRRVTLPRGVFRNLQKRRIFDLAEQGRSSRQIALACRVSERYVRRLLVPFGLSGQGRKPAKPSVGPKQQRRRATRGAA